MEEEGGGQWVGWEDTITHTHTHTCKPRDTHMHHIPIHNTHTTFTPGYAKHGHMDT